MTLYVWMMQNPIKMQFKCYLEDQNQTTESAIQASVAFHTYGIYMATHFCSLPGFEEACPPASVWNRLWDVSAASLGFFCSVPVKIPTGPPIQDGLSASHLEE